jgi:hypothetical protein
MHQRSWINLEIRSTDPGQSTPNFSSILMFGRQIHNHNFPPDLLQPERVTETIASELSQPVSASYWAVPLPDGSLHVWRPLGSQ